jgi:hypothetical protein
LVLRAGSLRVLAQHRRTGCGRGHQRGEARPHIGSCPLLPSVSPGAPFYGGATFKRVRGSKGAFTGKLGVEFADHTKVELAGKGFEARLRLESINIHPG